MAEASVSTARSKFFLRMQYGLIAVWPADIAGRSRLSLKFDSWHAGPDKGFSEIQRPTQPTLSPPVSDAMQVEAQGAAEPGVLALSAALAICSGLAALSSQPKILLSLLFPYTALVEAGRGPKLPRGHISGPLRRISKMGLNGHEDRSGPGSRVAKERSKILARVWAIKPLHHLLMTINPTHHNLQIRIYGTRGRRRGLASNEALSRGRCYACELRYYLRPTVSRHHFSASIIGLRAFLHLFLDYFVSKFWSPPEI